MLIEYDVDSFSKPALSLNFKCFFPSVVRIASQIKFKAHYILYQIINANFWNELPRMFTPRTFH